MTDVCDHQDHPNPRSKGCCVRCGKMIPQDRPRDRRLERELTLLAANAGGLTTTGGLDDFADQRALPGGVRVDIDPDREAAEELADARNYLVWGIERDWQAYLGGDGQAAARVDRRLRTLSRLVAAWHDLHTEAT